MKNKKKIDKITFIGLGLINSSLARDLKGKNFYNFSTVYSRRKSTLRKIKKLNLVDKIESDLEELKKVIKDIIKDQEKPINEAMRQRTLNEISSMVLKEDFYGFINAGNNMLRTLEERFEMREAKRYLEYLVRNNIM